MVGGPIISDYSTIVDGQELDDASPIPCTVCGRYRCIEFAKCPYMTTFNNHQRGVINRVLQCLMDNGEIQNMLIQCECRETPRLIEHVYPPNNVKVVEWTIQCGAKIFFQMWIQSSGWIDIAHPGLFPRVEMRFSSRLRSLMLRRDFKEYIWDLVHNRPCQMPTV